MTKSYEQECPVACTLDIVGERWAFLIIRDLLRQGRRFAELSASLEGVAPNMLSRRLKDLEAAGVVKRIVHDERPPRTEYTLTPKGRELGIVIGAMASWGSKHALRGSHFEHEACGHELEVALHCAHCRRAIGAGEQRIRVPKRARR